MMGPDYTYWPGMDEVSKNSYTRFLLQVVQAATARSVALKAEVGRMVPKTLVPVEHIWMNGLGPKEAEEWSRAYRIRDSE